MKSLLLKVEKVVSMPTLVPLSNWNKLLIKICEGKKVAVFRGLETIYGQNISWLFCILEIELFVFFLIHRMILKILQKNRILWENLSLCWSLKMQISNIW